MLTETARVVSVEKEALWVETIRRSTCGTCSVQKGCGHGLLNRIGDGRRNYVRVPGDGRDLSQYAVNDEVTITLPEETLLFGSFVVYVVPLLLLIGTAGLAAYLWPMAGDAAPVGGAIAGFALGLAIVRWHAWRHREDPAYQPSLRGKVSANPREPALIASV